MVNSSFHSDSDRISEFKNKGLEHLGIGAIKLYQRTISKVTPPRCRYYPSCSHYAIDAINRFGFIEGVKLARKRIKRCKPPFHGYDPVPMYLSCSLDEEDNQKKLQNATPNLKKSDKKEQNKKNPPKKKLTLDKEKINDKDKKKEKQTEKKSKNKKDRVIDENKDDITEEIIEFAVTEIFDPTFSSNSLKNQPRPNNSGGDDDDGCYFDGCDISDVFYLVDFWDFGGCDGCDGCDVEGCDGCDGCDGCSF